MNLPDALAKAVTTRRHNNPGRLSATTLLNGVKQYPQSPVYVYGFPVTRTNLFKIGGIIREKISTYEQYREQPDDAIPPCLARRVRGKPIRP
jgi:hypothetical protein